MGHVDIRMAHQLLRSLNASEAQASESRQHLERLFLGALRYGSSSGMGPATSNAVEMVRALAYILNVVADYLY